MIDNLGDLFEKFGDQETHRLRQVLLSHSEIQLVSASAYVLEHTFQYDKAFYEFFQIVQLKPITREQSIALMRVLGEKFSKKDEVENFLKTQAAKMEVLRRFTGGVPRTMALLFGIFMDHQSGSTFESLQLLLDEVNSLYKHRMDELKPQQQKIMDTLAKAWEPISTKQILEQSKLYRADVRSNQISAQLKSMEDNQLIESIEGQGKNKTYRIRERFFNIWYLMRYGKKYHKEEVLWLVKFLEEWCDKKELRTQVGYQMEAFRKGEFSAQAAYLKSMALYHTNGLEADQKLKLMEITEAYLTDRGSTKEAQQIGKEKANALSTIISKWEKEIINGSNLTNLEWLDELDTINIETIINKLVARILVGKKVNQKQLLKIKPILEDGYSKSISQAGIWLGYAIEDEEPNRSIQIWKKLDEEGNTNGSSALAWLNFKQQRFQEAEHYFIRATRNNEDTSFINLGWFYEHGNKDPKKAEKSFRQAIELGNKEAVWHIGWLYENCYKDFKQAILWYEKAVESRYYLALASLGRIYEVVYEDLSKAEEFYKKGADLGDYSSMTQLGKMYWFKKKDFDKAEEFLVKAKDSELGTVFIYLVGLYSEYSKNSKMMEISEQAFTLQEVVQNPLELKALMLLLISAKQFNFLYNQFKKPELNLMKYARPYWYVLMWFMKDQYPGEYEKVGSEIKETVDEIIREIQEAMDSKLTESR